jgi:hypothetical protein
VEILVVLVVEDGIQALAVLEPLVKEKMVVTGHLAALGMVVVEAVLVKLDFLQREVLLVMVVMV